MSTDLLMVQSDVLAIGNPIKDMHKTLSGFETRFESLEDLCKRLLESPAMPRSTPEVGNFCLELASPYSCLPQVLGYSEHDHQPTS
jgi:hypothetical protein